MIKKKTAVLMLSKQFMAGHSCAGEPTGFVDKIKAGTKLHTIRENYDYWAKKAEKINAGEMELSIRVWEGKPYNSRQVEVARLDKLGVQQMEACYGSTDAVPQIWIDGKEYLGDIEHIARNDGLSYEQWVNWFFQKSNTFEGVILQFTDFRY